MAETTLNEQAQNGADLAAAVRDRGIEQIEGAKGQLAEGAERVAAAVERTAGELEDDGDKAISGFGRSELDAPVGGWSARARRRGLRARAC